MAGRSTRTFFELAAPVALILAPLLPLYGCASVLGIEKAELDPEASGGTGGSGGHTSSSGATGTGAVTAGTGGAGVDAGADPNAKVGFCAEYCGAVMTNCTNVAGKAADGKQYTS